MDAAQFGGVLLEGLPRHSPMQPGLDCLDFDFWHLELEACIQPVTEPFVVSTEAIRCSAAAVLYLRGKVGGLVGGAAEVDKTVFRLRALTRRLDLKHDCFHFPWPRAYRFRSLV